MIDEGFAKQIERAMMLEDELPKVPLKAVPPKAVPPRDVSLTEQWDMSENIRSELRTRLADLRRQIRSDYEQQELRIRYDYERKLEEAVAALETEKFVALRRLADETAEKLREPDLLAKRMA